MKNKEFAAPLMIACGLTLAVSGGMFFIHRLCALLCLGLGAALIAVFAVYTRKRYKRLDALNNYLSLVCSGTFDLDVADNTEGELSILKNNLFKVISMLRHSNEALAQDRVYLAQALADISHQLKTPLTAMTMITDLLKAEQPPEKRREFVDIIETQLRKMRWLIQTLLKLSKIDAGTAAFVSEDVRASELIADSLRPFLLTLDLRNIRVEQRIRDFQFRGDRNWTAEAIQNIIKNCMEYTPDGGRITIETASTALYHEITISDTGCGIAEADLPHIFERFYRGAHPSADSVGIGLALSKSILQRQNAAVEAESAPGAGTRFIIRFYLSII